VYLLVFHAYVNEIHGSRSKIPSKKSRQAALRGGFNSGIKGLRNGLTSEYNHCGAERNLATLLSMETFTKLI
jgi:hypothetical protein